MVINSQQDTKPLQKLLISLESDEDLWPLNQTSKRKQRNFGQNSVNIFPNSNPNFDKLRAGVNPDDWQEVCADLKEVAMSCLLLINAFNFENSKFYNQRFLGTLINFLQPHFENIIRLNLALSNAQTNKYLSRCFEKVSFFVVLTSWILSDNFTKCKFWTR